MLWIIGVPFFLVYQNAIYCFFVWTHCFHWKLLLQIFQLFSVFDRLPPTHGLHLSEILKLGHCLTLQWSLWQEVFGISLVGGLLQNCHSIGCKTQVKLKLMQRFKLKYKTVQCCILKLSLLWMWGSISAWIFYSNIKIKMIRSLIECEIHLTHPKGCNSRKCHFAICLVNFSFLSVVHHYSCWPHYPLNGQSRQLNLRPD